MNNEIFIGASAGITIFPTDGQELEVLLRNADMAMNKAKEAGRGVYHYFMPQMNEQTMRRMALERDLRMAVERQELVVYYQPKIELATDRCREMEALVRWPHAERGMIAPSEFIPIAEETGLILAIGPMVMHMAVQQAKEWQEMGLGTFRVAVNLSARQFRQPLLAQQVAQILLDVGVGAEVLEVEVTEGMLMDDPEKVTQILKEIRSMGVTIALDDFGTGYSSLSYLKRFPIDNLKIDRSFVTNLADDANDLAIVTAIVSMARAMGLRVVAEGAETAVQVESLRKLACDQVQGYFFSRPLPAQGMTDYLLRQQGEGEP